MGKTQGSTKKSSKDSAEKAFMKINEVFADAFNGYFFQGKKVVIPDKLTPADTVSTVANNRLRGESAFSERIRDLLKRAVICSDGHTRFVLLGIENQSTVDPWMVLRCLEYDARTYMEQMEELCRIKRQATEGSASSVVFLQGKAANKLLPVVSLVIYFGPDKWSGPKSLHEMFGEMGDECNPFVRFAFDYRMNLIEPCQMNDKDFDVFTSNLREVLLVMKVARDRYTLKDLLARDKRFENMDPKAVDVINACTDAKIKYNETQRKVDMRSAFVEEREEGFAEGMEKGIERGIEKGRAEGQKQEKLAIALRMLTEKLLDVPTIAKVTGLTLQQVQDLQIAQ